MRVATRSLCSSLAIATALLFPQAVRAQSFAGTGTPQPGPSGSASIATAAGGPLLIQPSTTVTVTGQAVINWTPSDNAVGTGNSITFQPSNTTALFLSGNGQDFAVLNRILPADNTRQILLNGTIESYLQFAGPTGGQNIRGGTVWFYSPSGIILGNSSVINVGNLGLTTSDPWNGTGNWYNPGTGGTVVNLAQSLDRSIVTLSGSQITTAAGPSSYTAIVAPRITHSGTITTNGAAALVAADAATITFRTSNLFDIEVTAGTSNGTGLYIDGGKVLGEASTGASDTQRIYLVAVPKNQAMTMLIQNGAELGFTPATSASVDGSTIILSSGLSIESGDFFNPVSPAGTGNAIIQNATFRNKVGGFFTGNGNFQTLGGDLTFARDVSVESRTGNISFVASGAGRRISVGGNLFATSSRFFMTDATTPGLVTVNASNNGAMEVLGATFLRADGRGAGAASAGQTAGKGTGGAINVLAATGGVLSFNGNLNASADGIGGVPDVAGANAGAGQGGTIRIEAVDPNAQIRIGSSQAPVAITLSARGRGGSGFGVECFGCNGLGGAGTGGDIWVGTNFTGGSTQLFGDLSATASGLGGASASGTGGRGQGGTAQIQSFQGGTVNLTGNLALTATGVGGSAGNGGTGGEGKGGGAFTYVNRSGDTNAATLTIGGNAILDSSGLGGAGFGAGSTGGKGAGGSTLLAKFGGVISIGGNASALSTGTGGSGVSAGGEATGGITQLYNLGTPAGSTAVAGNLLLDSNALGGAGVTGGNAKAGQSLVEAGTGQVTVSGSLTQRADSTGGAGTTGAGGNADGATGTVSLATISGGGGTLTVAGLTQSSARARGGDSDSGAGGNALGGQARIIGTGTVNLNGGLRLDASAIGGGSEGGGAGGNATGGLAAISRSSGTLTVRGDTTILALAESGFGTGGGVARGGFARIQSTNGTVNLFGETQLYAYALGGFGEGAAGGNATGGEATVDGTNASITLSSADLAAWAAGGNGDAGGNGTGGLARLGTNGSLSVIGGATLSANGRGGTGFNGNGGNGQGGTAVLNAFNGGTLDLNTDTGLNTTLVASGTGGSSYLAAGTGGAGRGGNVSVAASSGATVNLRNGGFMDSSGYGATASDGRAGAGTGGQIFLTASGNGSQLLAGDDIVAWADGIANAFSECISCGTVGSDGTGGQISVVATGNGGLIDLDGTLELSASGIGSAGVTGAGGRGQGGSVAIGTNGGSIAVAGTLDLEANGRGGVAAGGSQGGAGQGGIARIYGLAAGDSLSAGYSSLSASGFGGAQLPGFVNDAVGGNGTGGEATVSAQGGAITLAGVAAEAEGSGGDVSRGTGGTGGGGFALLEAVDSGALTINGTADLSASGFGGSGVTGGNGFGSGRLDADGFWLEDGAQIFARNGTVTINGNANVLANGRGGNGALGGRGGDGTGGVAMITTVNSDDGPALIRVQGSGALASVNALGTGGRGGDGMNGADGSNGSNGAGGATGSAGTAGTAGQAGTGGGAGGDGFGGIVRVLGTAGNGTLNLAALTSDATGRGGAGGAGGNGGAGGDGGAGGAGTAGAGGAGGPGGAGGNGGSGGAGGVGDGGNIQVGTYSQPNIAGSANLGSATFGALALTASGVGGAGGVGGNAGSGGSGGAGGSGTTVNGAVGAGGPAGIFGAGGRGGDALNGGTVILARGSLVRIVGQGILTANATGGNGGLGGGGGLGNPGFGGDATIGGPGRGLVVLTTNRFTLPAQRGRLEAGSIVGTAIALGGQSPAGDGLASTRGGNLFQFTNSDGQIGSISMLSSADFTDPAAVPDLLSIDNGSVAVDGSFAWVTTGALTLTSDNLGALQAGSINLDAGTFVRAALLPATPGTYTAGSWSVTTGDDFIVTAHLKSLGGLQVTAPGSISVYNVETADDLSLDADGGPLDGMDLTSGAFMALEAESNIKVTGDIDSATGLSIRSLNGAVDLQNVASGGNATIQALLGVSGVNFDVDGLLRITSLDSGITGELIDAGGVLLSAEGDILTGDIVSGGSTNIASSAGGVTTGNIDSLGQVRVAANGDILLGNVLARRAEILLTASAGGITAGNLTAQGGGVFASAAGAISAGDLLSAGSNFSESSLDIVLDSDTSIAVGDATAAWNLVFISDGTTDAGNLRAGRHVLLLGDGDIDVGSIDTGSTHNLLIASSSMGELGGSATFFNVGAVLNADELSTSGGARIRGNAAVGGDAAIFVGSDLDARNITAGQSIDMDAGGNIQTANLTASDSVGGLAGGNITVGAVSAGLVNPSTAEDAEFNAGFAARGSIQAGNISARNLVGLAAGNMISTGNLSSAQASILILGTNAIQLGSVSTPTNGEVLIGNASMLALGGDVGEDDFDVGAIFAATQIAPTAGSLSIGGALTTGRLRAAIGTTISAQAVNVVQGASLTAGGNILAGNMAASSGGIVLLSQSGAINSGNLSATSPLFVLAGGPASLGTVTTTGGADLTIRSGTGGLTTGAISAGGRALLISGGALTSGAIGAGGNIALLADGSIATGALNAGPGTIVIGDNGMAALGGASLFNYNWAGLVQGALVATNGGLTVGGPVQAQRLRGAVGQNASFAGAVSTTQGLVFLAGGSLAISGAWTAPTIDLASSDIVIGDNGRLQTPAGGEIILRSRRSGQTLLGDGLTGNGYALSNAEVGRISTGTLSVVTGGVAGADADVRIGNLTIAAGPNGTITSPTGAFRLITLAENGQALDGNVRITGALAGTGFGADTELEILTERLLIDAAAGSIALTGQGSALSGLLLVTADKVYAAENNILDKLLANPAYVGREADINTPTLVSRPEGIIRAAAIEISGANQVLVQNTGTRDLPAGVLARDGDIIVAELVGAAAAAAADGPVELIINGQIDGENGLLTGVAAWRAVIEDEEFEPSLYTANSSINGCLLTAATCGKGNVPLFVPRNEDIQLGTPPKLADKMFATQQGLVGDEDEGTEQEGEDSPIAPPEKLVDGKPLDASQLIEEPVSGGGNPALIEARGGQE